MVAAFVALPPELEDLTSAVDFARVERLRATGAMSTRRMRAYDFIHAFTRQHAEIEECLADLQDRADSPTA